MRSNARVVHDVYFELRDASSEAQQILVDACYERLAAIAGVEFLAAGTRDVELQRDVNDRSWHVSLHVWFTDRAAHDAYQTAASHQRFVDENHANWKSVRVFDATIAPR